MHRFSKFAESQDLQLANFEFATFPEALMHMVGKERLGLKGLNLSQNLMNPY